MNTQKIIGYKAPYSLAEGLVDKGTIFKLYDKDRRFYTPNGESSPYLLPKEIVETWEAVYEDEFKVGDFVYVIKSQAGSFGAENRVGKLTNSINTQGIGEKEKKFKGKFNVLIEGVVWNIGKADVRKATQQEIDSLFNKTLTLSNGKEVIVKRGVIKANNETVSLENWKNLLITNKKVNSYDVELIDATYKIGCWKDVKLADIQLIVKTCQEQSELMKD